jgi:hypothetical protein
LVLWGAGWRTSSWTQEDECVEVAGSGGRILLRDSKDPDGTVLRLPAAEWVLFVPRHGD